MKDTDYDLTDEDLKKHFDEKYKGWEKILKY